MAHFAEIDENNIVKRVIVVNNDELIIDGVESEEKGITFCKLIFGNDTNWVQTSYNRNFRKNYPGPGFLYDKAHDMFISPRPFNSWILDLATGNWGAPVSMPLGDILTFWDEDSLTWNPYLD